MLKKKTSVVIISNDGKANKKIQIPSIIVENWKLILYTSVSLIVVFISFFSYSSYHNHANMSKQLKEYNERINRLTAQNNEYSEEGSSNNANIENIKKSMSQVDSTLVRIDKKLKKRGISTPFLKNAGGPLEKEDLDIEELAKYYETTLKDVEHRLDGTPLGRPLNGRFTSRFGYRPGVFSGRGRETHSGLDIKGRIGDPIRSTAKGEVVFAGYKGGYGKVICVKHANGYETRYAHLSKIGVKTGQKVTAGMLIGAVGNTGRSSGPHLHYEVLFGGRKLNPEKFIQL